MAAFLDLPRDAVTCTVPDVGGAFGGKLVHPWPEEVLTAWAAHHLDHPVAWTEDRTENLTATSQERGQRHEVEVGFDNEGQILALDLRFLHDTGAYTPYGIIVPHVTATQLLGPYQGHETVLAQVVAAELGCDISQVTADTGRTDLVPFGAGTYASRTAAVTASAAAEAARQVRARALQVAAEHLGRQPEALVLRDGIVAGHDPTEELTLAQIAVLANPLRYSFDTVSLVATQFARPRQRPALAPGEQPGLDSTAYFAPRRATCSYGVHVAVVETDPETCRTTVLRYVVVHDCGNPLNPMLVEGQIRGGVAQGLAGALFERIVHTPEGNQLTTTYADLLTPGAADVPDIEIDHLRHPTSLNPLGAKGVGEAGVIPVAAVIASAVEDALGTVIDRAPMLPDTLHHLQATVERSGRS